MEIEASEEKGQQRCKKDLQRIRGGFEELDQKIHT